MILVVNDACLLIDLIDADLFDEFLQLGFNFHITTLVLNELSDEYEAPVSDCIRKKCMVAISLSGEDQIAIAKMKQALSNNLSIPDLSCLFLAKRIGATVLTCDQTLRQAAKLQALPVHGSLWVLDQLIEAAIITQKTAFRKLTKLMTINSRLPKKECEKRLKLWK